MTGSEIGNILVKVMYAEGRFVTETQPFNKPVFSFLFMLK